MYILPSLFTTANVAFGYYAILEVMHASAIDFWHLDNAAKPLDLRCCLMASTAASRA